MPKLINKITRVAATFSDDPFAARFLSMRDSERSVHATRLLVTGVVWDGGRTKATVGPEDNAVGS